MFDDATISRLAHQHGLEVDVVREICQQVERKQSVVKPEALAASWCRVRRQRLDEAKRATEALAAHSQTHDTAAGATPLASQANTQRLSFSDDGYADMQVALENLERIRQIIGDRSHSDGTLATFDIGSGTPQEVNLRGDIA